MARLRIFAFVGMGIVATLAILPQTRWVVINDLATIGGDSKGNNFYGCLDPRHSADDAENAKAKAVLLEEVAVNPGSGEFRLKLLSEYCRRHPRDISAWAHLIRMVAKMPMHSPDGPK